MEPESPFEAIAITKLGNTNINLVNASFKILKYSVSTITSNLLQMVIDFTNIFIVSRLGNPDYIASFGLAQLCVSISCLCFILGMCSACETLCSQAYGNKNNKLIGEIFNRGQLIMVVLGVILCGLMYFSNILLEKVGMDKDLCDFAAHYIRPYMISAFVLGQFELTKRFLQTQQIFYPQMIISGITAVIHPLWVIIFMKLIDDKFEAISFARSLTNLIAYLGLVFYISFSKCCIDTWHLPGRSSFNDWWPFVKLGLYGIAFTCVEWWAFELVNVFAGYINNLSLAANILATYINNFYVMIPLGIGMAATSMVGNSIGELNSQNARQYARASLFVALLICCSLSLLVLIFSKYVAMFFTEDAGVERLFVALLPILMLEEIFENAQSILGKVIVGMGMQDQIAKVGVIVYYIVVLPAAYLLSVKVGWGLYGIWSSVAFGMFIICIWYAKIILKTDWDKLIEDTIGLLSLMNAKIEDEDECSEHNFLEEGNLEIDK